MDLVSAKFSFIPVCDSIFFINWTKTSYCLNFLVLQKLVRILVYFYFVEGVYRLTGLVHISEASWDTIQDMRNLFAEGDEVKVKVIDIDR